MSSLTFMWKKPENVRLQAVGYCLRWGPMARHRMNGGNSWCSQKLPGWGSGGGRPLRESCSRWAFSLEEPRRLWRGSSRWATACHSTGGRCPLRADKEKRRMPWINLIVLKCYTKSVTMGAIEPGCRRCQPAKRAAPRWRRRGLASQKRSVVIVLTCWKTVPTSLARRRVSQPSWTRFRSALVQSEEPRPQATASSREKALGAAAPSFPLAIPPMASHRPRCKR